MSLPEWLDAAADYRFAGQSIRHVSRSRGTFYAVNIVCLDDAAPDELAAAPVSYEDGRDQSSLEPRRSPNEALLFRVPQSAKGLRGREVSERARRVRPRRPR
jgi:hypothetical protein